MKTNDLCFLSSDKIPSKKPHKMHPNLRVKIKVYNTK